MAVTVNDDEVLTLAEAAAYLRVSERTLWQLSRDGEIPHRRVGNSYRYLRRVLREHVAGGSIATGE